MSTDGQDIGPFAYSAYCFAFAQCVPRPLRMWTLPRYIKYMKPYHTVPIPQVDRNIMAENTLVWHHIHTHSLFFHSVQDWSTIKH